MCGWRQRRRLCCWWPQGRQLTRSSRNVRQPAGVDSVHACVDVAASQRKAQMKRSTTLCAPCETALSLLAQ